MSTPEANQEPPAGRRPKAPSILVVGAGNLLLRDDGVGIHAVRAFAKQAPGDVPAVEVGTDPWCALHLLEESDKVIVFDALKGGGAPGSVYALGMADVRRQPVQGSLHEIDLVTVWATMKEPRPEVLVVAAEPLSIECGIELTPELAAAVPRMVEAARKFVDAWRAQGAAAIHSTTDPAVSYQGSEARPLERRPCREDGIAAGA